MLNGVVQRTVRRLRGDVEDKLHRLPLSYFDTKPRGELLSRVTNDIDNIQQTMQQTMSQLLNSLLTLIGVLTMMVLISPLLALIALVSVPLSILVTTLVAKRSQPLFVQQWGQTGRLNAHIEEIYTGHSLVKVFGHQEEAEEVFRERNEALYRASFGAQFFSGIIMPSIMFIGNLNYVLIAVIGGLRVASGSMSLGDVQAFIQYSRQFSQPLTQVASMSNLLQSGVASAERVFELLDADEQVPGPGRARAGAATRRVGSPSSTCRSATSRTPRSSRTCRWSPRPASRSRSSARPAPARRRWSTSSCASTSSTPAASPSTASTSPP